MTKVKTVFSSPREAAMEMGGDTMQQHILFCRGPNCCHTEQGDAVWTHLKNRLKALKLSGKGGQVYRTKVDCMRICQNGPICVVQPEGAWYDSVDENKMEQILQKHCLHHPDATPEPFLTNPLIAHE